MLKSFTKLLVAVAVITVAGYASGYSQVVPVNNADIGLAINFPPPAIDKIKLTELAKFDPNSKGGTSRILFAVTIRNNVSEPRRIADGQLKLRFSYNGKTLITFENGKDVIIRANETINLTNLNALKGDSRFNFTISGGFSIQPILDVLYGAGVTSSDIDISAPLPAGEYAFSLELNGSPDSPALASIQLSNPTGYVEIIGPGSPFGSGDPMVIADRQPVITWIGDAPSFLVKVIEKTGNTNSIGDLLSKQANFETSTKSRFVRYPAAGVTPLVAGKTYVVLVGSVVNTLGAAQANVEWAPPLEFKIAETTSAADQATNQFLERLKNLIGTQYEAEFAKLEGGTLMGSPSVDGKSLNTREFMELGQKFQIGQATVKSVKVK